MIWFVKSHHTHPKPEASSFYHLARRLSEPRVVVFSPEVETVRNPGRDSFPSMTKLRISPSLLLFQSQERRSLLQLTKLLGPLLDGP